MSKTCRYIKRYCVFFIMAAMALLVAGCSGGSGGGSSQSGGASDTTGSLDFGIQFTDVDGADLNRSTRTVDCDETGVETIRAYVYDASDNLIATGGPWACTAHSGTIEGVPAGSDRKLTVKGLSADGREYYTGEMAGITVHGGQSNHVGYVQAEPVFYIGDRYIRIQYRTYPDSNWNNYLGVFNISKAGKSVNPSDIVKIELKDGSDKKVDSKAPHYTRDLYYIGEYHESTGNVMLAEVIDGTEYSFRFPDDIEIAAGDYTYEVLTATGQTLRKTIYYPGKLELPTIDADEITTEWLADGSLRISWKNPSGTFDRNSFWFEDQDGNTKFAFSVPPDVEEISIPASEIEKLTEFGNPIFVTFWMRNVAYTEEGMQYARGYANSVTFDWNDITIDFLDYFPLTQGSSWLKTAGENQRKTVMEDYETIHGVQAIQRVYYTSEYEDMTVAEDYDLFSYDSEYIYIHGVNQVSDVPWRDQPLGLTQYDPPLTIKRSMKIGEPYTSTSTATDPDGVQTEISLTTELLEFDTINVQAGNFENCAIVSTIMTSGSETDNETSALAKGVGVVGEQDQHGTNQLISADIFDMSENLSFWWHNLEYRNYSDSSQNRYIIQVGLLNDGLAANEFNIESISLRASDYTLITTQALQFWDDEEFAFRWDPSVKEFEFSGPDRSTGSYCYIPDISELAAGYYVLEVTGIAGNTIVQDVYFPGDREMPIPDASSMKGEWQSDGSLKLSWVNPPGEFDRIQIGIDTSNQDAMLWGNIDSEYNIESMTIPSDVVQAMTEQYNNPDYIVWNLRTRVYSDEGMGYARGISDAVIIPWSSDVAVRNSYLQYRTFENTGGSYRGYIELVKAGGPVQESDVSNIRLLDGSGAPVEISGSGFYEDTYYRAEWNENSGGFENLELVPENGFWLNFPSGINIPEGNYTYEITLTDGQVLNESFYFPGPVDIPVPQSSAMTYQWQSDGSLYLSWVNPVGSYDYIQVTLETENGESLFYTKSLSPDINELTLPVEWVERLTDFKNPANVRWRVRTRSYTSDGMHYARGYSDPVTIQWFGSSSAFTIPYANISVDGNTDDWAGLQPAFVDDVNDEDPGVDFDGMDIHEFYLARDDTFLYMLMTLNDGPPRTENTGYFFRLTENYSSGERAIGVSVDQTLTGYVNISEVDSFGNFNEIAAYPSYGQGGQNFIEYRAPLSDLGTITGKSINLWSHYFEADYPSDMNDTNVQLILD